MKTVAAGTVGNAKKGRAGAAWMTSQSPVRRMLNGGCGAPAPEFISYIRNASALINNGDRMHHHFTVFPKIRKNSNWIARGEDGTDRPIAFMIDWNGEPTPIFVKLGELLKLFGEFKSGASGGKDLLFMNEKRSNFDVSIGTKKWIGRGKLEVCVVDLNVERFFFLLHPTVNARSAL